MCARRRPAAGRTVRRLARAHGLDVVLVVDHQPGWCGTYAVEHGIPVVGPGAELAAGLDEHPADVLLSIANLRVIPDDVLGPGRRRRSTSTTGRFPGYAGLNVTTWALLAGEHEHAITWHVMTADVDGGDVVAVRALPDRRRRDGVLAQRPVLRGGAGQLPPVAAALAAGTRRHRRPSPTGERPHVPAPRSPGSASSTRRTRRRDGACGAGPRPRAPPAQHDRGRAPRARRRGARRRAAHGRRQPVRRARRDVDRRSTTTAPGSPRRTATS